MRRRQAKPLARALVSWALVLAAAAATSAPAALAATTAATPSAMTGRLLVTVAPQDSGNDLRAAAASALSAGGLRRDGAQVPQIGLVSVRPTPGTSLGALARSLRRRDGVLHVEAERRHELRVELNDPALAAQETNAPSGTPVQWWIGRLGLPAAWDISRGTGATVAVIDTGVDSGHPDISGKVQQSTDNDNLAGHGPATQDENGHGTHVSSIACGAGNNGVGMVGVGLDCQLLVYKSDLSDGSVARSIIQAADANADAINMSFGTDGTTPPARVIVDAISYAIAHDVVVVAAAADSAVEEQGDPANVLQPTGTGPDVTAGKGLTVTSANNAGQRSSFAGRGSQISIAAYGSFNDAGGGPPGLFAAFPGNATELEAGGGVLFPQAGCSCRTSFQGDTRFAYLQGTSMAAPMVTAVAAMVKNLNPDLRATDVVRLLKETATRPAGTGWTPDLGWGIVNPLVSMTVARTIDRRTPASQLKGPKSVRGSKSITLRVSGADSAPGGLVASGIDHYDIYRSANRRAYRRITSTSASSTKVKVKAGSRYRFYSIAVDRAGNREAVPARADVSFRVLRRR